MADQSIVSEALAEAYGLQFTEVWVLIPIVVLCYDHILTLQSEITYMWKQPKRLSFFMGILLRYGSLFSNVAMLFLRCHAWNLGKTVLIILQSLLVGIILGMRIYAMYNFSKTVLTILCGAGLITIIMAAWSTGEASITAIGVIGCEYSVSKDSKGFPHEVMYVRPEVDRFLCDVTIFGFTIIRAYRQPIKIIGSILSFMVRDGKILIILSRALALVNLANILVDYKLLASSSVMLSVTMMSRLMLNLHEAANVGIFSTQSVQTTLEFQSDCIRYDEEANIGRGLKAQVEKAQTVSSG
ncbi:hypothetical protein K438DRAFT_1751017 [Mycena galopus ATCC 62051]|nr:hypothetical protein K438DRAFT_1751017 [Mycena galopus ATCC 62051]